MTDERPIGEMCRDDVIQAMAASYPNPTTRRQILAAGIDWARDWAPNQIDAALQVLKKRAQIAQDVDGYHLRTAPAGYNARLVEEANAAGTKAPEPVKRGVSTLDERPIEAALSWPQLPTAKPGAHPVGSREEAAAERALRAQKDEPALDPDAARQALQELEKRLTVEPGAVASLEFKLEVLDHLGRILDDSIEAVLVEIARDLRGA